MSFETWFERLMEYAREQGHTNLSLIECAYFMYEEYHATCLSPEEAYHREWG